MQLLIQRQLSDGKTDLQKRIDGMNINQIISHLTLPFKRLTANLCAKLQMTTDLPTSLHRMLLQLKHLVSMNVNERMT